MKILVITLSLLVTTYSHAGASKTWSCINEEYALSFQITSVSPRSFVIEDSTIEGLSKGMRLRLFKYRSWFQLKDTSGKVVANVEEGQELHIFVPHPHGLRMTYDFRCEKK